MLDLSKILTCRKKQPTMKQDEAGQHLLAKKQTSGGGISAKSMLSSIVNDLTLKIDLDRLSLNPYPQQQVEAAFQAQHTSKRFYAIIISSACICAIHLGTCWLSMVVESTSSQAAGLHPLVWAFSGCVQLLFCITAIAKRRTWRNWHCAMYHWSMFLVFLFYLLQGVVSAKIFHNTADFTVMEASSASVRACVATIATIGFMGQCAMPVWLFSLPLLYAVSFCSSLVLCGHSTCLHFLGGTIMTIGIAYCTLLDQRRNFATRASLLRARLAEKKEDQRRLETLREQEQQKAGYMRIGASVINHEAKRAISNTMTWMDEIELSVIAQLETGCNENAIQALKKIAAQVRIDNEDAFQGCKSVIAQQQIAAGQYVSRLEPFEIRTYVEAHIACRQNVQVQIASDFPSVIEVDQAVLTSFLRNLMNNAEVHGKRTGTIIFRLFVKDARLYIEITNEPGVNHPRCLELQAEHGKNFLLQKHAALIASSEKLGSENSTFLGMREISTSAGILDAVVDVVFKDLVVVTTIQLLKTQIIEYPKKLNQTLPEADEAATAITTSAAACEGLDYSKMMFIYCDDDRAPRAMGRRMLQTIGAGDGSLVLGETHTEILSVPDIVLHAVSERDQHDIVCMFDQNMHFPEAEVTGTELTGLLRAQGFKGLIIIRSANDSAENLQHYHAAGADASICKGVRPAKVREELSRLIHLRKAGAVLGFALHSQKRDDVLVRTKLVRTKTI